jgi:hypothetical protein
VVGRAEPNRGRIVAETVCRGHQVTALFMVGPEWTVYRTASPHLNGECEWVLTDGVLPTDLVTYNRLRAVRWLIEHGFDPFEPGCEIDVLKSGL